MINGTNLRKNNYKFNYNNPNLINSSLSSLNSDCNSIPGDRIKLSKIKFILFNFDSFKKKSFKQKTRNY